MNLVEEISIIDAIEECRKMNRKSQGVVYKHFFSYGMSIALRYTKHKEDAIEVINDSFLKAFTQIKNFKTDGNFKAWLRTIIINTSIDKYRISIKNPSHYLDDESEAENISISNELLNQIDSEEIIFNIQQLPNIYRITFNLYEIEGYSHKEISQQLNINESKSRTNLSRAKKLLRSLINKNTKYETVS